MTRKMTENMNLAEGVVQRLNKKLGLDIQICGYNNGFQAQYKQQSILLSPLGSPKELVEWLYACEKGVDLQRELRPTPHPAENLTSDDWREIYYAIDSKRTSVETGRLGPETHEGADVDWVTHIEHILNIIGE